MKSKMFFIAASLLILSSCVDTNIEWAQEGGRLKVMSPNFTKYVEFYSPRIARVTTLEGANEAFPEDTSLVVTDRTVESFELSEKFSSIELTCGELKIEIDKETGNICFRNDEGNVLLKELATEPYINDSIYQVEQQFKISDSEALYGLGQYQSGNLNHRGKEVLLTQSNSVSVVPFLLSTANYGVLWDNYSRTLFKDNSKGLSFKSVVGKAVDYYVVAGDDMDEVIAGYRALSGKAPMFPKSAYGFWQSKERYQSFDDIFRVAQEYRNRKLPIDNIVQDWQYWGGNEYWTSMQFVPDRYPNPAENIAKLRAMNIKIMCSIWPALGKKTQLYKELDKIGAIHHQAGHWTGGKVYDVYNPEARQMYAKAAMEGLIDLGVTGLWLDGVEVELNNTTTQAHTEAKMLELGDNHMGSYKKYLNTYSLMAVSDLYHAFRARNDVRPFILTRSAFAGQQRYGAVTWSGDIGASWKILKDQIAAGVNFSAAGIPYWSHDIGGFFPNANGGEYPGGVADMAYRELYVRWFQFGVFTPIFRSHGTGTPREIYQFGNEGGMFYDAIADGLRLRYKLMPYIYSQAWNIYANDYTLMRPMAMNFKDTKVHAINDAYMFGDEFLVKPVCREMYHKKMSIGEVITTDYLSTPSGEKGLAVSYYNDKVLEKKVFETVHPQVDFNWGGISPENLSFHNYSMRWEGCITPDATGKYRIGVLGDDGFRLWINGEQKIDCWQQQASTYKHVDIELTKGKAIDIKLEYFQAVGGADIKLTWFTPEMLLGENNELYLTQTTYLPADCGWYDYWTNEYYKGGQSVDKECPMNIFPLYVKEGSIIPTTEGLMYADQKTDKPIAVHIYAGANGEFVYYEDAGDGFEYLDGDYAAVSFVWNDNDRTLTVARAGGNRPLAENRFEIILIDNNGKESCSKMIELETEESTVSF